MSSSFPQSGRYQNGGYSVIADNTIKIAFSIDDVLNKWHNTDEIKYRKPDCSQKTGYYYSNSQQAEGFLEKGQRFFAHLIDPTAQAAHREGIDAVINELRNRSLTNSTPQARSEAASVTQDFQARKFFGQPLSVKALKTSLNKAQPPSSTQTVNCPSSPLINFFGKRNEAGKYQERPSSLLAKSLSFSQTFSRRKGYQPINSNARKRGSSLLEIPYQLGLIERRTLKPEDFPLVTNEQSEEKALELTRQPPLEGKVSQHHTSTNSDQKVSRQQEETKPSQYGSISRTPDNIRNQRHSSERKNTSRDSGRIFED